MLINVNKLYICCYPGSLKYANYVTFHSCCAPFARKRPAVGKQYKAPVLSICPHDPKSGHSYQLATLNCR